MATGGRYPFTYESTAFSKGINENADDSDLEQASSALNVWRPLGRLETRPGYVHVVSSGFVASSAVVFAARAETNGVFSSPSGAGVLTLGALVKNRDHWYIGHTATFGTFTLKVNVVNTNTTVGKAEYWNGDRWVALSIFPQGVDGVTGYKHLSADPSVFITAAPGDWAQTSVDSLTRYWIRVSIRCADLSAGTEIDVDNASTVVGTNYGLIMGLFAPQLPTNKYAVLIKRYATTVSSAATLALRYANDFAPTDVSGTTLATSATDTEAVKAEAPATMAVVPEFNEIYVAYSHRCYRFGKQEDTAVVASVESRDFATGDGAPYDPKTIAQLGAWPNAGLIAFFKGRLWAADLEGEPFTVRWSAAQPFHRVWPNLSYERIMEFDNSPITAMAPLGEHMIVFKNDSIWAMIPIGENQATGVEAYVPQQVVVGVGCVARNSVRQIRGRLIFMAEDGVYAFDGTPQVEKLSDRIDVTMQSAAKGRRKFAASEHWRTKSCYLLSFSTAGQANDTTVVWDYKHDNWWVWDNIDAQSWCVIEGGHDQERLFFGDQNGQVFEFGKGTTDHGAAISSYVQTQRFGYGGNETRTLRDVRLTTSNQSRALTVTAYGSDRPGYSGTISTVDYNEPDWGALDWSGADADNWNTERRLPRHENMRIEGAWHQVKVSHSTHGQRFHLSRLELGFNPIGRR